MNKGLLIQVTVLMPLTVAVTIFFALGWWIPAGVAILGAVVAAVWIHRSVENRKIDEVIAANPGLDDSQPLSFSARTMNPTAAGPRDDQR